MKVTIIGIGWVGKAMQKLFPDAYIYSIGIGNKKQANKGDIAFICVPTPNLIDSKGREGALDTSIVEKCVRWCKCPLIVIRSTVNPGTCDYLIDKYNKGDVVLFNVLSDLRLIERGIDLRDQQDDIGIGQGSGSCTIWAIWFLGVPTMSI